MGQTTGRNRTAKGRQKKAEPGFDLELWDLNKEPRRRSADVRGGNSHPVRSAKRRKRKKRRAFLYRIFEVAMIVSCLVLIYHMLGEIYQIRYGRKDLDKVIIDTISEMSPDKRIEPPTVIQDYIEVNDYSRPGTSLKEIKNIFVHYTANPGTTAAQNRSYFANLATTHERSASAHFIIGYEGELVQCIPLSEQAYAVMTRNADSISIECCYLSEDGSFTEETYDTLIHTLAWLIDEYDLTTGDILRHYDCGGKLCPIYYVEHEDAWEKLLLDVEQYGKPEIDIVRK